MQKQEHTAAGFKGGGRKGGTVITQTSWMSGAAVGSSTAVLRPEASCCEQLSCAVRQQQHLWPRHNSTSLTVVTSLQTLPRSWEAHLLCKALSQGKNHCSKKTTRKASKAAALNL